MDLIDMLHDINQKSMDAYGLSDLAIGTVTKADPLEVTIREAMAPLPQEVLHLTAAVVEKKIPVLTHEHITSGFRYRHIVSGLEHTHDGPEGSTGDALDGDYPTSDGLTPDAYTSDQRLQHIVCYEDGKPLPVEDGYIILNRALAVGDKVLLLRCMRGQQFIILSRVFERGPKNGDTAAVRR